MLKHERDIIFNEQRSKNFSAGLRVLLIILMIPANLALIIQENCHTCTGKLNNDKILAVFSVPLSTKLSPAVIASLASKLQSVFSDFYMKSWKNKWDI